MSPDSAEIVRKLVDAFNKGGFDPMAFDFFHPDVELSEWPDAPDARTFRGREGLLSAQQSWAEVWEWQQVETRDFVEAGDVVFVEFHHRAKGKGSSVEVEQDTFNVLTLRDGLVIRMQMFTHKDQALRAAGLSETAIESEETR